MQIGVVKWYDCRKGYGFIVSETGEDVLAHFSVIEGTGFRRLWDGEKVEYEATRGPKGLNATYVRRLDPPPPEGKKSPPLPGPPAPTTEPPLPHTDSP